LILQSIKNYLVRLGPDHALVRGSLRLHAWEKGFRLRFSSEGFELEKQTRKLVLSKGQYIQVPWMLANFDFFFETMEGESRNGITTLDFSKPGFHRYKSGVGFYFPSIPEDDVTAIYTAEYLPQAGDVVWDAGAHAGATTYFLAQMVGPNGRVYAFEPDDTNLKFLQRNIEFHGLKNVIPVKKALGGRKGVAAFNMDGTMAAGLREYLTYVDEAATKTVELTTIEAACEELCSTPAYIKMDIEGAEVDAVRGSLDFLKAHGIHFAIESGHVVDGALTCVALEEQFASIGYKVRTSTESGQVFTWAGPHDD
jgi:FkbM family methyltransferase